MADKALTSLGPGPAYNLPSTIGYEDHTPTKERRPAYSLGLKHQAEATLGTGPGPAAYSLPKGLLNKGPDGSPEFSVVGRNAIITRINPAPGPGAYAPEKHTYPRLPEAPEYSMSSRNKDLTQTNLGPGPAAYMLPSAVGEYQVIGAGSPAFTLHERTKMYDFTADFSRTPGPGAYPPTNINLVKQEPYSYSVVGKAKDLKLHVTPGADTYFPNCDNVLPRAPSFVLGDRHSSKAGIFSVPMNPKDDPFYEVCQLKRDE